MKPRFSRSNNESGSASLEFLTMGVILLVPLAYCVLALSEIQNAQLAVEGAARSAARLYSRSPKLMADTTGPQSQIDAVLRDHRVEDAMRHVSAWCSPTPHCSGQADRVTVEVGVDVPLIGIPVFLSGNNVGIIRVSSRATHAISRFVKSPA